jgi:RimJ/RimL family protein N-acetyltransferase
MNEFYRLRPATLEDAKLLFEWRNDPSTRAASHDTAEIGWETHIAWLEKILADPNRRLLLAQRGDAPVGTVRADFANGVYELSWTVAPEYRGCGVGAAIVRKVAEEIPEALRAEVKVGNTASARIAEKAGMRFMGEILGILHFARDALNR